MKTCATCFRCIEDWRDAKAKGLDIRHHEINGYRLKPRFGVNTVGMCACFLDREAFRPGAPACAKHIPRWRWNIETWWVWHVTPPIKDWYRRCIRVPIGMLRKPAPLDRQDYFSGIADLIEPGGLLVCPHCGEVPYSAHHCVFCGQRFLNTYEQGSATVESMPPLSAEAQADIEKLFSDE